MTRVLPPTHLGSSTLVRQLAAFAATDAPAAAAPIAERLGEWLAFTDALSLFAALDRPAAGQDSAAGRHRPGADLMAEIARARSALAGAITASASESAGVAPGRRLPRPRPDAPVEVAADFAPYHRYYLTQQRDLATAVGKLRTKARETLASTSPRLRQLADLDAALDLALSPREQDLLASVPAMLEMRFETLRDLHRQQLAGTMEEDDPAAWMAPGAWLARFCAELQTVLLAELELRLQPVQGLAEAWHKETNGTQ